MPSSTSVQCVGLPRKLKLPLKGTCQPALEGFNLYLTPFLILFSLGQITKPEDFDKYIVPNVSGVNSCSICHVFSHVAKSNVRNHVESKHFPNTFFYNCNICNKVCNSRQALQQHRSKKCAKKIKNLSY